MPVQSCGLVAAVGLLACPVAALAEAALPPPPPEQALEDAWWTGPMLASGAGS